MPKSSGQTCSSQRKSTGIVLCLLRDPTGISRDFFLAWGELSHRQPGMQDAGLGEEHCQPAQILRRQTARAVAFPLSMLDSASIWNISEVCRPVSVWKRHLDLIWETTRGAFIVGLCLKIVLTYSLFDHLSQEEEKSCSFHLQLHTSKSVTFRGKSEENWIYY